MPEVVLNGCSPEPLMGYLKALGVFRLVAEQADANARGGWVDNSFVLESALDGNELRAFFLDRYQPTPILAPWNGGGGFYGGGSEPLKNILASTSPRLADYRQSIQLVRDIVLDGVTDKPSDESKDALLLRCRSALPDKIVSWLDCCFVLGENKTFYFPLLGTGGNDGRLDFTNNFMQRLNDVLAFADGASPGESLGWLNAAIFAEGFTALARSAIGQFNPGGIGGANGVQGRFEADSRVNPWDFVLMIEGALNLAGALSRRLGATGSSRSAFPFTVESVAVGYGSATATEETTDGSRAELWLPLWDNRASAPEIANLFAEGRVQFGRHQAKNSVEFAIAISTLGVNRGIRAFTRYGFLKRNGLAYLAAPLGRFAVTPRPMARLLEDSALSEWINKLRDACRDKDRTPTRFQSALRQIDQAIYRFANRSETSLESDRAPLLEVLRALGRAERTLAAGLSFCADKLIRPLQRLDPKWLTQANDETPEFRLAASLAGVCGDGSVPQMRAYLEPIEAKGDYAGWSPESITAVWTKRPLSYNLAAMFQRRQLDSFRVGQAGIPLESPWTARPADISAFLYERTDDDKLSDLIWAMVGVKWSEVSTNLSENYYPLPFEFAVPRLLTRTATLRPATNSWSYSVHAAESNVMPDRDIYNALDTGQSRAVERCVDLASRRLATGGLVVVGRRNRLHANRELTSGSCIAPQRLLAAMIFPLSTTCLSRIASDVLALPESEE